MHQQPSTQDKFTEPGDLNNDKYTTSCVPSRFAEDPRALVPFDIYITTFFQRKPLRLPAHWELGAIPSWR